MTPAPRPRFQPFVRFALLAAAVVAGWPAATSAQILQPFPIGGAPGVYVEADGTVKRREIAEGPELAQMRARAKAVADAAKGEQLAFVSLPKAFAAAKEAIAAGKPIPDDVKYLGGITQLKFVFVYGDEKDLVIAGPSEPVKVIDAHTAIGTKTARPVFRLEDFVVAMRTVRAVRNGAFGCRLDPDPAAPARVTDTVAKMARATRAERIKAVASATGPQKVSFFGGVPDDTRFAFATIAADYELKRYGLGLARTTVAGLGNGIDNSGEAVSMIWFSLGYDPILVTPEGDAYGIRGPRLKVQAGSFNWDPKGATKAAFDFAGRMTKYVEALANQQPLLADLQCLADLSVLAALIQRDRLDQKVGWDTEWVMQATGDAAGSFPVAKVTIPKTADALANYTNGAIAAGGVVLSPAGVVNAKREEGVDKDLSAARDLAKKMRSAKPGAAVVGQP